MKELIKESFIQNPTALEKLLITKNATLTHTQDKGKWGKEFPKLLMEVRSELNNKPKGQIVLKIINDWVLSGKATTTVRNPSYHNTFYKGDGIYMTDQEYPVEIKHLGTVKIINDRVVGKYVNYSKEEFAEKEGFETWNNFVENSKYAGQSLIKGESVHLYSIKPHKVENQEMINLVLSKIKANFDTYLPQLELLDITTQEELDNYPDKNKIYYTICNFK